MLRWDSIRDIINVGRVVIYIDRVLNVWMRLMAGLIDLKCIVGSYCIYCDVSD